MNEQILIAAIPSMFLFCVYYIRNEIVFNYREFVMINEGFDAWKSLPDFEIMVLKFWIWDMRKFNPKTVKVKS